MIRHSKSLILVWQLAELEALNLKQDTIKPAHFLLGILKVVDIDLFKILEKQVEEVADEIRYDIVDLKSCLARSGGTPGTYGVTLSAAGTQLTGGRNSANQSFYVTIP